MVFLTVFPVFVRSDVSHLIFLRSDIVDIVVRSILIVFFGGLDRKGVEDRKKMQETWSDFRNFFGCPISKKLCKKVRKFFWLCHPQKVTYFECCPQKAVFVESCSFFFLKVTELPTKRCFGFNVIHKKAFYF